MARISDDLRVQRSRQLDARDDADRARREPRDPGMIQQTTVSGQQLQIISKGVVTNVLTLGAPPTVPFGVASTGFSTIPTPNHDLGGVLVPQTQVIVNAPIRDRTPIGQSFIQPLISGGVWANQQSFCPCGTCVSVNPGTANVAIEYGTLDSGRHIFANARLTNSFLASNIFVDFYAFPFAITQGFNIFNFGDGASTQVYHGFVLSCEGGNYILSHTVGMPFVIEFFDFAETGLTPNYTAPSGIQRIFTTHTTGVLQSCKPFICQFSGPPDSAELYSSHESSPPTVVTTTFPPTNNRWYNPPAPFQPFGTYSMTVTDG